MPHPSKLTPTTPALALHFRVLPGILWAMLYEDCLHDSDTKAVLFHNLLVIYNQVLIRVLCRLRDTNTQSTLCDGSLIVLHCTAR